MDVLPSTILSFEEVDDQIHFSSIPPPLLHHSSANLPMATTNGRHRKSSINFFDNPHDHHKKQKLLHRDVERQRRQEMATLYRSLRSQIPVKWLKGKRSISDHMDGAVKYVQNLQKRIEELNGKKDELMMKKLGLLDSSSSSTPNVKSECSVRVLCEGGIGVIISSPTNGGQLPLSRILKLLVEEGLTTVSCISGKATQRLIYNIESEVSDGRSIDPNELHQKLIERLKS